MSGRWRHRIRVRLAADAAETVRRDPSARAIAPLAEILRRRGAALVCQYDAFAAYVAEAERRGAGAFPLYAWTRATIDDPVKKAKYVRSFTVHVGGEEVYPEGAADALEADLRPLVGGPLVAATSRHDTNPANNPQVPKRYRS